MYKPLHKENTSPSQFPSSINFDSFQNPFSGRTIIFFAFICEATILEEEDISNNLEEQITDVRVQARI